ncbi:hypothetical protein, partial [Limosilactobacillus fermentum]|uniref:hypothetical protein n=1 Tax=Limosilactobacillus fermentum TaxID=1613 RepID=UPI003B9FCF7C
AESASCEVVAEDETALLTDETACTDVEVDAALPLDTTAELAAPTVATALTPTFVALTWLVTEALSVAELSLAVANITCWLLLDVDCALALATTGFSLTLSACAF